MIIGKLIFNLLNAVLFFIGVALAIVGFWNYGFPEVPEAGDYDQTLRHFSAAIGYTGLVVICIAVVGAVARNCSIKILEIVYVVALIVVAVAFILVGALCYYNVAQLRQLVRDNLKKEVESFSEKSGNHSTPLDDIQKSYECCGVEGASFKTKPLLPASCCPKGTKQCTSATSYKTTCDAEVDKGFSKVMFYLATVSLAVAIYAVALIVVGKCCI